MRRTTLSCLLAVLFVIPAVLQARTLRLTLGSGRQVQGELLNTDANGVYLKGQSGRTYFFKSKDIVKAVDPDSGEDLTEDLTNRMGGSSSDSNWTPGRESGEKEAAPSKPQPPDTDAGAEPVYRVNPEARRTHARWSRTPPPFKPGFGLDLGVSGGGRTPNTVLQRQWREWVPAPIADYTPPSPSSVDLAVMFQGTPRFSFGGFGQWYPRCLGTTAGVAGTLDSYDNVYGDTFTGPFQDLTYDYRFGAIAYGAKVRLKGPKSRAALTLYGGRISLVDSGLRVDDAYGVLMSDSYTGSAPYWRTDLEFNVVPARRGGMVLALGYQWAHIRTVTTTAMDGTTSVLTNYTDGRSVDVDLSGFRAGLFAVSRF